MLQATLGAQFARAAAMMNLSAAEIESITGIRQPRIQIPTGPPNVHTGDVKLTNINVKDSVVGGISAGDLKQIDVTISALRSTGDADAGAALQRVTEAVLDAQVLASEAKDELIQQLALLAAQANLPANDRKKGVIKSVFATIKSGAGAAESVAKAWAAAEPIVRRIFGLD